MKFKLQILFKFRGMNHYIFLLDNSYSMSGYLDKLADVVNKFAAELKRNNVYNNTLISIVSFSCNMLWMTKKLDINSFHNLNEFDFKNKGSTSLYDTVSNTILEFIKDESDNKHLYIVTDGDDNSSLKYDRQTTDELCQIAINSGKWDVKHFDTLNYLTLTVPKVQFDIDNINCLFDNLQL